MGKFLAKRRMSVWLIIAAIILDAIMIVPSFWSAVMHGLAALCMFAARRIAIHEGRLGTLVPVIRSQAVTPAAE